MKKFNLLMLCICMALAANAQWTRTNVDTMNTGVEALCEHNGSLYASIYNKGLIKYDNATSQWLEVADNLPPTGNSAHIVNLASVDNYLYAYVNDQFTASTTIYRSADSGTTFVTDSVGHPRYGPFPASTAGFPMNVHDVFVLDGQLFNVIGGGAYTKKPADAAWVKVTDPNVKFSESFAQYNSTWYATYTNKFYTSTDQGATWVQPANTGLTTGFSKTRLNVNPASGRIYVANTPGPFDVQKLFYSDNEGDTWDSLPINQYIGPGAIGGPQIIKGMIGNGSDMTIMLTNNATSTVIDVIKSTDGGQTFALDTVGLPWDQFGAIGFVEFIYFKNQLWFAPNSPDIYIQGAGSVGVKNIAKTNATVYPNPFTHTLTITNEQNITAVTVMDMLGNTVLKENASAQSHTIDLSKVPSGVYFLSITSKDQVQILKVVKQ